MGPRSGAQWVIQKDGHFRRGFFLPLALGWPGLSILTRQGATTLHMGVEK